MLERYENNENVLWVCGTNYLGSYAPQSGDSYVFTHHMLPCGWASWSNKFLKYYDGELSLLDNPTTIDSVRKNYCNKNVFKQYRNSWMGEYRRIRAGVRPESWDFQMDFCIKAHGLYGVCPCNNQIKNIGVDDCSIHGGTSFENVMTKRFCGMESYPIVFPLKHPEKVEIDKKFEKRIGKIILYPFKMRLRIKLAKFVRKFIKKSSKNN